MVRLNAEWTQLLDAYEQRHADPRNQICHDIGIPLAAAALPLALLGVSLAAAFSALVVGIFFLMAGHRFDGTAPAVVEEPRHLVVALIWWLERRGVDFDKPIKSEVEARK